MLYFLNRRNTWELKEELPDISVYYNRLREMEKHRVKLEDDFAQPEKFFITFFEVKIVFLLLKPKITSEPICLQILIISLTKLDTTHK